MSPFPHFTFKKRLKISILFIILEIVCGNLKNRQIICSLNSIKFYIADCERSYQKFYIKLFSRMWIFRQNLIRSKFAAESCLRLQVLRPEEEEKVYPFYLVESLSLTFVFSSQPSSAFAYIVVNKNLFLGDLRKSPRLIVKPRKCVKLIFYDQDWERTPPDSGCPSRPASWKRQSRWWL